VGMTFARCRCWYRRLYTAQRLRSVATPLARPVVTPSSRGAGPSGSAGVCCR